MNVYSSRKLIIPTTVIKGINPLEYTSNAAREIFVFHPVSSELRLTTPYSRFLIQFTVGSFFILCSSPFLNPVLDLFNCRFLTWFTVGSRPLNCRFRNWFWVGSYPFLPFSFPTVGSWPLLHSLLILCYHRFLSFLNNVTCSILRPLIVL